MTIVESFFTNYLLVASFLALIISAVKIYYSLIEKDKEVLVIFSISFLVSLIFIIYACFLQNK